MPTSTMPVAPAVLRVEFKSGGRPKKVDKEKGIIYGAVCALEGPFKDLRGEFNYDGLVLIRDQMAAAKHGGLRSRFTHPSLSADGLGKFLGRWSNPSLGTYENKQCVRADFTVSKTAYDTPSGNLAKYILDLADDDAEALSTSLVIEPEERYQLNDDNTRKTGPDGEPLPPLWYSKRLWALDFVDVGDAVDGLLSGESLAPGTQIDRDNLPDALQRQGFQMLDKLFGDAAADVVKARTGEFVERYLRHRGGVGKPVEESQAKSVQQMANLRELLAAGVEAGVTSPFALAKLGVPG